MLENQTGEYYFKQMKCSQKMKFKRNFIEYQEKTALENFNSIMVQNFLDFETFVLSSFIFSDTKEGDEYWFSVIAKIKNKELCQKKS